MSIKARVSLGVVPVIVAAVAVPAGLLSADASTSAEASTTACGSACASPWNESLGSGEVLAVSGSSVEMAAASTTNSAEDFTPEEEGGVTAAEQAGIISPKLNFQYSNDSVFEFQYAPDGVPKNECLADGYGSVATINTEGTYYAPSLTVTLQPCGITAATLWIPDNDGTGNEPCDLINAGYEAAYSYGYQNYDDTTSQGYTSPFAEPTVLTVNSSGDVVLAPLSEIGGVVSPTQEWSGLSPQVEAALQESAQRKAAEKAG
jgi:hypothetical protein